MTYTDNTARAAVAGAALFARLCTAQRPPIPGCSVDYRCTGLYSQASGDLIAVIRPALVAP